MHRILIVEDDDKLASIVSGHLEKYDYEVYRATDYSDVKGEVVRTSPSLVLLDINLPQYDGFYWCRQIRTVSTVPVIFISARTDAMDQVRAVENGGDDYITKPFSLEVVLAKVRGALRRAYGEYATTGQPVAPVREVGGLFLDSTRHLLEWEGRRSSLTPNEFLLLDILMKNVGRVVPRRQLLETLWDDQDFVDDNTLSVNITRVRKKLAELGIENAIETVRGKGYRLNMTWRNPE